MPTLVQPSVETAPKVRLAFDGGPKTVPTSPRDRWKHVRLRDLVPIVRFAHYSVSTFAAGEGPISGFENEFASLCGCRFALAMNSGTAALHSALFAVGVGPGDEVILPSYTWQASASSILCCGATPVFCDIDPRTLTADPQDISRRITPRTKAIMPVHVWGNPADMEAICQIAARNGIPVVEDCSHAHGATLHGKSVGAWGDIGCFSLQGTKAVSAGEGGIAVCNDAKYYDRMLALGHPVRTATGLQGNEFNIGMLCLGPKYRPHLYGVILAHKSLRRLPQLNTLRRRNWEILCQELDGCQGVRPVETLDGAVRGGFLEFKFVLDLDVIGVSRDQYVEALSAEGVNASPDRYGHLHEIRFFGNAGPLKASMLTETGPATPVEPPLINTEGLANRVFTLPAYADVEESVVHQVGVAMRKVADHIAGN